MIILPDIDTYICYVESAISRWRPMLGQSAAEFESRNACHQDVNLAMLVIKTSIIVMPGTKATTIVLSAAAGD